METQAIGTLLRDFKKKKIHMAIVQDEFGSVRGLVTLEDIIEEIVGEISDEYDKDEFRWKAIDQHTVLTDAKVDIEEVEEYFKVDLPEGTYESVGGLIIEKLGRLPDAGESVQVGSLVFLVKSATQRRISTVKIQQIN